MATFLTKVLDTRNAGRFDGDETATKTTNNNKTAKQLQNNLEKQLKIVKQYNKKHKFFTGGAGHAIVVEFPFVENSFLTFVWSRVARSLRKLEGINVTPSRPIYPRTLDLFKKTNKIAKEK